MKFCVAEQELSQRLTQELGVGIRLRIATTEVAADELSPAEKKVLAGFKTAWRQLCWRRGRQALKQLFSDAGQSADSGAISFPHANYSITHCGDVAIAVGIGTDSGSSQPALCGVGVDLDLQRKINNKITRFYLNHKELHGQQQEDLLRLWTMKEAMFKSDPENQNRLLTDYEADDARLWCGRGKIIGESLTRIRYSSISWEGGFVSAAVLEAPNYPG